MQKVHPKVLWDMRYTYIIYIYISEEEWNQFGDRFTK